MSRVRDSFHQLRSINRRKFIYYGAAVLSTGILAGCANESKQASASSPSSANSAAESKLDKVTFGTNWYAQAEHGGFYQAVATGIYKSYGLDVTIKMGGAQVNGTLLLMGGAVDFFMGDGANAFKAVEEGIPKITVAAIFQKDPQVLLAHPGVGNDSLFNLKGKPIFVSAAANTTYWPLLVKKFGFFVVLLCFYNFSVGFFFFVFFFVFLVF